MNRQISVPEQLLVDIQAELGNWLDQVNFELEYADENSWEDEDENKVVRVREIERQMHEIEELLSEQE